MGDWLIENGLDRSKPYHSADVLHQLLHTDVVSLGRAASGSAEALVLREPKYSEKSLIVTYFRPLKNQSRY